MASIQKRKNKNGTMHWRAVVRIKGYPSVSNHFDRKQEAEDWAADTERKIKIGQFRFAQHKVLHTFAELLEYYQNSGALEHHKAKQDTIRYLDYWKERLKDYALVHLTSNFIAKERQFIAETPSTKGVKRSPATVNRYMAALSAMMTYASRELGWIEENPCFKLIKLKESEGRDRILTKEEADRLLATCRQSKNTYLYAIVLMAITTGMRQGEILGVKWHQIDFDHATVHLKDTKNGRPRSVPLVDTVIIELKQIYAQKEPHKELVFASRTAFGTLDIKKAWQYALKRAKIQNLRFHDLRHTFATLAARGGASNLELSTAMGHRTLQMLQRYTHLEGEHTRHLGQNIWRDYFDK